MQESPIHIAIAGNIGAGKSTLAKMLSEHFNWDVAYEAVSDNPYLEDYYKDMKRWAFHVQVCFLNSRFEQLKMIQNNSKTTIQDRSIYEDAYVFAKSLHQQGLLTDRDYHNYQRLFHSMMEYIQPPHLLIYLQSSVSNLQINIKQRARDYEKEISAGYLHSLNEHYEAWLKNYSLGSILIIKSDEVDFVLDKTHFDVIVNQVNNLLFK